MANNPLKVGIDDGDLPPLGATTDADASGNGSLIGVLKRIRTLFGGGLPSALVANRLPVDGSGVTQPVSAAGTVLAETTTTLLASTLYASSTIDVTGYSTIAIIVASDVRSAAGGIVLRWTDTSGNIVREEIHTLQPRSINGSRAGVSLLARPRAKNLRVIYTNGGTNQAFFSLQVIGRQFRTAGSPDGVTSYGSEYLRLPDTFKSVQATASGDTAVWTPATNGSFRLMRFKLQVTANAYMAARGVLTIKLRDNATDLNLSHDVYLGQTAIAADVNPQGLPLLDTGWIDLGNGILSAAANQALNVNLSAALSGGNVRVIAAGVEE